MKRMFTKMFYMGVHNYKNFVKSITVKHEGINVIFKDFN